MNCPYEREALALRGNGRKEALDKFPGHWYFPGLNPSKTKFQPIITPIPVIFSSCKSRFRQRESGNHCSKFMVFIQLMISWSKLKFMEFEII
jgi:hypothetical protein